MAKTFKQILSVPESAERTRTLKSLVTQLFDIYDHNELLDGLITADDSSSGRKRHINSLDELLNSDKYGYFLFKNEKLVNSLLENGKLKIEIPQG